MAIEKIIVLGTEINFRNHLENYLRRCRYDVATAATLATARDYLSRDNFDLIFFGFKPAGREGTELLRELAGASAKAPGR